MQGLRWKAPLIMGVLAAAGALAGQPAYAHGFGERYDLPVPLGLYIGGAGVVVALSFAIIWAFVRGSPGLHGYPRLNLLEWRAGRLLAHPWMLLPVKVASVFLFVVLVLAGWLGDQAPGLNLVPTLIWVIWWVGLAYVSAFVGNIWALINPWKIIFGWAEGLYKLFDPGGQLSYNRPYPSRLGIWPAVALFGAFAWAELVFPDSAKPWNLAGMALLYSLVTWAGMLIFGRQVWLRHGEAFSLVFGYLSRFSPTEVRVRSSEVCQACSLECRNRDSECVDCYECYQRAGADQREWNLRPFAAGLLVHEEVSPSRMVLVLLMLATVTFDGFTATSPWASIVDDTLSTFSFLGGEAFTGVSTVGLLVFPVLFLLVFLGFSALITALAGGRMPVGEVARVFVYSLIPIALAYHLAHFLSFLLIQGQLIVPLISDPLGRGWDLFGTAGYQVDIGVINAKTTWFIAVAAIVVGHIVAVYVAHVYALRTFGERRIALRSQYPVLALMVGYTMMSLWIIAQALVKTSA